MFKNILDYSLKRNWKQAIGFYVAYLFLGIVLGAVAGALSTVFSSEDASIEEIEVVAVQAGTLVAIVYSFVITMLVLIKKKLYKNFWYIILVALSPVFSFLGGALFGFLIPSFMTTRMNDVDNTPDNATNETSGDNLNKSPIETSSESPAVV